jgi:hypothetical protein
MVSAQQERRPTDSGQLVGGRVFHGENIAGTRHDVWTVSAKHSGSLLEQLPDVFLC